MWKKETKQVLFFGGPWTVNGLTLQLMPWQSYIELVFTNLNKAMVWIQLHNLPMELWDGEALETLTEPIRRFLKADDFTSSLFWARYVRLCTKISLSWPLKKSFWLEDGEASVFVVILYERLPTFCFVCGLERHGANSYSHRLEKSLRDQMMEETSTEALLPRILGLLLRFFSLDRRQQLAQWSGPTGKFF